MANLYEAAIKRFLSGVSVMWWRLNERGEKEFRGNKDSWLEAAGLAQQCSGFKTDVEEELVSDEPVSCYNCRYRRWTNKSFICKWL
jgi:hypothetical protein